MTTPGYGTFGNLGRDYQNARQEFPAAVFTLFQDLLEAVPGETRVLDIGCVTGIATRQLRECGYIVSGSDVDADMIAIAKEIRCGN